MNLSYCENRLNTTQISTKQNQVLLWQSCERIDEKGIKWSDKELRPEAILRPHEKGLEILSYDINRNKLTHTPEGYRWKKSSGIVRLEKPLTTKEGGILKYLAPKGQTIYPLIPPGVIDKFDKTEIIKTLIFTEGGIKALKGAIHGIDIIGFPSITNIRNKETGGLHPDLITLIKTCNIKRLVWLMDGDCLDVSNKAVNSKDRVDLYKRPAMFFSSVNNFKQACADLDLELYAFHVDTDTIWSEFKDKLESRDKVKGLDDIMVAFPEKIPEIVADINSVSSNGFWFRKINISIGLSKVRDHFRLQNVNTFILFQQERNPTLKNKNFIFNGTEYRYNEEKGECDVIIPGAANLYFRVGDNYYKWVLLPNQYKQLERQFHERSKSTIIDDHGKAFLSHITKYEAFCNVPDHINHQQNNNNCFNVYSKIEHEPDGEVATSQDFPSIFNLLNHIAGESEASFVCPNTKEKKTYKVLDLLYDYLQILYLQPQKKLPILCLVSRENNTGKSTFANLLKLIFSANVAIVGNADLASDFNGHIATKLIVVCDETKIDKQHVFERVKMLSTARKIWMNAKGKAQIELDCFIKFVLISNNEDNFISASDEDIRFWVIKVPVLTSENPDILDQFVIEMPAFLSFLSTRKLATENKNRMWFHPDLLKTDALKKIIQHSQPGVIKEITYNIRELFFDFGEEEILLTLSAIRKDFFNNKYESSYLMKVLKDNLRIDLFHTWQIELFKELDPKRRFKNFKTQKEAEEFINTLSNINLASSPEKKYKTTSFDYPRWEEKISEEGKSRELVKVKDNGRPYVFKRKMFISDEEWIANLDPEKQPFKQGAMEFPSF